MQISSNDPSKMLSQLEETLHQAEAEREGAIKELISASSKDEINAAKTKYASSQEKVQDIYKQVHEFVSKLEKNPPERPKSLNFVKSLFTKEAPAVSPPSQEVLQQANKVRDEANRMLAVRIEPDAKKAEISRISTEIQKQEAENWKDFMPSSSHDDRSMIINAYFNSTAHCDPPLSDQMKQTLLKVIITKQLSKFQGTQVVTERVGADTVNFLVDKGASFHVYPSISQGANAQIFQAANNVLRVIETHKMAYAGPLAENEKAALEHLKRPEVRDMPGCDNIEDPKKIKYLADGRTAQVSPLRKNKDVNLQVKTTMFAREVLNLEENELASFSHLTPQEKEDFIKRRMTSNGNNERLQAFCEKLETAPANREKLINVCIAYLKDLYVYFNRDMRQAVFAQLINGHRHMALNGVVHGDVMPSNILWEMNADNTLPRLRYGDLETAFRLSNLPTEPCPFLLTNPTQNRDLATFLGEFGASDNPGPKVSKDEALDCFCRCGFFTKRENRYQPNRERMRQLVTVIDKSVKGNELTQAENQLLRTCVDEGLLFLTGKKITGALRINKEGMAFLNKALSTATQGRGITPAVNYNNENLDNWEQFCLMSSKPQNAAAVMLSEEQFQLGLTLYEAITGEPLPRPSDKHVPELLPKKLLLIEDKLTERGLEKKQVDLIVNFLRPKPPAPRTILTRIAEQSSEDAKKDAKKFEEEVAKFSMNPDELPPGYIQLAEKYGFRRDFLLFNPPEVPPAVVPATAAPQQAAAAASSSRITREEAPTPFGKRVFRAQKKV